MGLLEYKDSMNPFTKEPTVSTKKTFHPTLKKILVFVADKMAGDCENTNEILNAIKSLEDEVERLSKEMNNES